MMHTDSDSRSRSIEAADYPTAGEAADQLRFLLRYAVLAPSGHNTQPWLFKVMDNEVDIRTDRSRALPIVDPYHRELVISCGAALHHLRLAIKHFGHGEETRLLPDPADPDLLAVIRLVPATEAGVEGGDEAMFEAITRRRSNRRAYKMRAVRQSC
jgi:nitroreductase